MRRTLMTLLCAGALVVAAAACSDDADPADEAAADTTAAPATTAAPTTTAAPSGPVDVMTVEDFAPLAAGEYYIDPDGDPSTSLRVDYDVAGERWFQWLGAGKDVPDGHLAVSITTVDNVVGQACTDHELRDPAIGPTVQDLAGALSDLAPFEVTTPASDVTAYGYDGQHLVLTIPELPVSASGGEFAGCTNGNLASWAAAHLGNDAFYGYGTAPGTTEEFWVLDVDGTRLMISALRTPASSEQDLADLTDVLDSIQIEA